MTRITYYDRNMNPITTEERNRIQNWWDSFRPGFPGFTYGEGGAQRVVMINPTTKEETTMYYKKEIIVNKKGFHQYI